MDFTQILKSWRHSPLHLVSGATGRPLSGMSSFFSTPLCVTKLAAGATRCVPPSVICRYWSRIRKLILKPSPRPWYWSSDGRPAKTIGTFSPSWPTPVGRNGSLQGASPPSSPFFGSRAWLPTVTQMPVPKAASGIASQRYSPEQIWPSAPVSMKPGNSSVPGWN